MFVSMFGAARILALSASLQATPTVFTAADCEACCAACPCPVCVCCDGAACEACDCCGYCESDAMAAETAVIPVDDAGCAAIAPCAQADGR